MAYNRKQAEAQHGPALVVMALILFTATADAQLPIVGPVLGPIVGPILTPIVGPILSPIGGLLNLTALNVTGRLCCTPTGNCLLGSPGVPGVVVGLNCTNLAGVSIQIGQGTTNVNGNFNISVANVLNTLGNVLTLNPLIPCKIIVPLPLNQTLCPILNTTQGLLSGVPSILTGLVQGISGLLQGLFTVPLLTLTLNARV